MTKKIKKKEQIKQLYFNEGIRDYDLIAKKINSSVLCVRKTICLLKKAQATAKPNKDFKACSNCGIELKPKQKDYCSICIQFKDTIKETKDRRKQTALKEVTIGSDIEFLFKDKENQFIPAYNILPRSTRNKVGCDGCSSTAEIRPNFNNDVFLFAKEIKKCLEKAHNKTIEKGFKDIEMISGSGFNNSAIGGHIHFGMEAKRNLISCFDTISILLSGKDSKEQRRNRLNNSGYGRLGDYENKSYGFEYRTIQSYIKNPKLAIGTLALYHLVAMEYNEYGINSTALKELIAIRKNLKNSDYKFRNCYTFSKTKTKIIQSITKLNLLKQNKKNYRGVILNFLETAKRQDKGKVIKVNKDEWNLREIKRMVDLFSYGMDEYLNEIKVKVKNPKMEIRMDDKVKIIGINQDRQIDIYTNVKTFKTILKNFAKKHNLIYSEYIGNLNYSSENLIGFSFDMRQNKPTLIFEILEKISKRMIKKAKSEGLKCVG